MGGYASGGTMIYIGYVSACDGQGTAIGRGYGAVLSLYGGMFNAGDGCGHKHFGLTRYDLGDGSSLDEHQDRNTLPHYYDVDIPHDEDGNGEVYKGLCTNHMEVVKF